MDSTLDLHMQCQSAIIIPHFLNLPVVKNSIVFLLRKKCNSGGLYRMEKRWYSLEPYFSLFLYDWELESLTKFLEDLYAVDLNAREEDRMLCPSFNK